MSEVKKIATRESYGNALVEVGKENPNVVVLDADLAAATKTGTFKKAFPERHIDCGIAECNMTGIAAGMATTGKIPFISSFAMFAAGRNFEQIRNSIGYPHLNVKIGATHAGISVGEDGATHQCNEDIALMRTIPGMVVIVDNNNLQIDGEITEVNSPYPIDKKFEAFNFHVININGNDFDEIDAAFKEAKTVKGKPVAIIAKTVKGKGVSYMENQVGWHGSAPNDEQYEIGMKDLEKAGEALCQK